MSCNKPFRATNNHCNKQSMQQTFPCFADGTGGDCADDCADSLDADSLDVSFFTFFSTESPPPCNGLESPFSSRFEGAGECES